MLWKLSTKIFHLYFSSCFLQTSEQKFKSKYSALQYFSNNTKFVKIGSLIKKIMASKIISGEHFFVLNMPSTCFLFVYCYEPSFQNCSSSCRLQLRSKNNNHWSPNKTNWRNPTVWILSITWSNKTYFWLFSLLWMAERTARHISSTFVVETFALLLNDMDW